MTPRGTDTSPTRTASSASASTAERSPGWNSTSATQGDGSNGWSSETPSPTEASDRSADLESNDSGRARAAVDTAGQVAGAVDGAMSDYDSRAVIETVVGRENFDKLDDATQRLGGLLRRLRGDR